MNVTERFLKYITFATASDEDSTTFPSTSGQLVLADYLTEELRMIGVADAQRDLNGYVYGHIPATPGFENEPVIGLIAVSYTHLDVYKRQLQGRLGFKQDSCRDPYLPAS